MENSNSQQQPRIKASDILKRLQGEPGQGGETREEIRRSLGLSHKEAKVIFGSPSLKGRKTIKPITSVLFEDDLTPTGNATTSENVTAVGSISNLEQSAPQTEAQPQTEAAPETLQAPEAQPEPTPEAAPVATEEVQEVEAEEEERDIFDDVENTRPPFDR